MDAKTGHMIAYSDGNGLLKPDGTPFDAKAPFQPASPPVTYDKWLEAKNASPASTPSP